jgi:hypothetical protein
VRVGARAARHGEGHLGEGHRASPPAALGAPGSSLPIG